MNQISGGVSLCVEMLTHISVMCGPNIMDDNQTSDSAGAEPCHRVESISGDESQLWYYDILHTHIAPGGPFKWGKIQNAIFWTFHDPRS